MSENISDTEIDLPVDQCVDQSVGHNAYIRQLTMETMINQDLLRKIRYKKAKESQTIFKPNFKDQASEWLEQLLKDYDHPFPKYDIPCEIREGFDAFMKTCNEHWNQHWETTKRMDLGMEMDTEWASDNLDTKLDTKNENDKEISMLPIYMKFQHPIWNNGSFNHKHGKYNHPHLNKKSIGISYQDNSQTLFPENMD